MTQTTPPMSVKARKAAAREANSSNGNGDTRKLDKSMRPLYQEIARLSSTLGIGRTACYDVDPGKVLEALQLLEMQLPAALKMAGILAPKPVASE